MATITKFIRLGFAPALLTKVQAEASQQNVSCTALIRVAVERHLSELNQQRIAARYAADKPRKER